MELPADGVGPVSAGAIVDVFGVLVGTGLMDRGYVDGSLVSVWYLGSLLLSGCAEVVAATYPP